MSKFMLSTISIVCSMIFATSAQAMETVGCSCIEEQLTSAQQDNNEHIDQTRERVVKLLHELKNMVGTRASRELGMCPQGQCYPRCPQPIDEVLEQILCILCSLKCHKGFDLCKIDHIEEWIALIEAIACDSVPCPKLPKNVCDALAQLADGLTELLHRIGCPDCEMSVPDSILGGLCYISSQIEVVDSKVDNIESKVVQIDDEIVDLTEKVDNVVDTIGDKDQDVDCGIINETDCDTIMAMDLSVIQWLKAIFAKIK